MHGFLQELQSQEDWGSDEDIERARDAGKGPRPAAKRPRLAGAAAPLFPSATLASLQGTEDEAEGAAAAATLAVSGGGRHKKRPPARAALAGDDGAIQEPSKARAPQPAAVLMPAQSGPLLDVGWIISQVGEACRQLQQPGSPTPQLLGPQEPPAASAAAVFPTSDLTFLRSIGGAGLDPFQPLRPSPGDKQGPGSAQ